jgi:hypothetical protein
MLNVAVVWFTVDNKYELVKAIDYQGTLVRICSVQVYRDELPVELYSYTTKCFYQTRGEVPCFFNLLFFFLSLCSKQHGYRIRSRINMSIMNHHTKKNTKYA